MLIDKWVRVDCSVRADMCSFKGESQGGKVPQLVEDLPSTYEALGCIPALWKEGVGLAYHPTIQRK